MTKTTPGLRPQPAIGSTGAADALSPAGALRIGDVAKLVGTTPRTIRYYEEIGLLQESLPRTSGSHRLYSEEEVDRLREVMRFKQLLGVSLEQLKTLLAAEEARSAVKEQLRRGGVDANRRKGLLEEALEHVEKQLELVQARLADLTRLQEELCSARRRIRCRIEELRSG